LKDGKVVFITMKLPEYITLPGGDQIQTYLLLRTTHDGTGRIMVYVVNIRVVCMNTLTWAIAGAKHKWGVTHTADVAAKVKQAQQALGFTIDYDAAFQAEAAAMMDIKVTDDQIVAFLKSQIEERPKKLELIDKIMFNVQTSPTIGDYAGTAWGAFNGITEELEHGQVHRSAQAQFIRTFEGDHFKIRSSLRSHLLSLA
jgi:phage/plasmid-like protein (TIGR03299 family)